MKQLKQLLLLLLLFFTYANSFAQIAEFNFNSDPYLNSNHSENGITISAIDLSSGTISTNQTTGTYFTDEPYIAESGGWAETSQSSAKYFHFTISAQAGKSFSITKISYQAYATSAGPSAYGIAVNEQNIIEENASDGNLQTIESTVSGFENQTVATIKIQGWDNASRETSGSGIFRLDNIKVYGSVQNLEVTADRLEIQYIPEFVMQNENWQTSIAATDENGNIDTDFSEQITISKTEGQGALSSTEGLTANFVNGLATFTNLKYSGNDNFKVNFTTANLASNSVESNTISVVQPLTNDDFSDNNFSENPPWVGNTDYFTVNETGQLQSEGPQTASEFYLSAFNTRASDTEWQFTLDLGFNPTSSNFVRVYLTSDEQDLTQSLNGYFIQVGETSEDFIRFFKQTGTEITELANGTTPYGSDIQTKIKVTRTETGDWTIFSSPIGEDNFLPELSVNETTFTESNFFGVFCKYSTTSRYNLFRFDDFYIGEIIPDTEKPVLNSAQAVTKNKLTLKFSEYLDENSALTTSNYLLNNSHNPASAEFEKTDRSSVLLTFTQAFAENVENTIKVENVSDFSENTIETTQHKFIYTPIELSEFIVYSSTKVILNFTQKINEAYAENLTNFVLNSSTNPTEIQLSDNKKTIELRFSNDFENNQENSLQLAEVETQTGDKVSIESITFIYHKPELFDIVFTEIMPDPEPLVELPAEEYIEIYNRSNYTISLKDWVLIANTSEKELPAYNLPSGEYLILCKEQTKTLFENYGNVVALESFPALTNSGMLLKLKTHGNRLIDLVNYSENWIENEIKCDGGWSIERIDITNFCGEADNWKASESTQGGTPGTENSVKADNPDQNAPELERVELIDPNHLKIIFTERFDKNLLVNTDFEVDNSIGNPSGIITYEDALYSCILEFNESFMEQTIYTLTINSGISDCAGNNLPQTYEIRFAIPAKAETGDIVINEVLFNPYPNCVDFLELYNRSNKIIDLKTLLLTKRDENENLESRIEIDDSYLLFPGEYVVITSDKENIKQNYIAENERAFAENDLPSMPDDEGNVVLLNQNLDVIDEMSYSDDMHYALISNSEGISLERIDFEERSYDVSNWHSAAENIGWATPTYQNSAYKPTPEFEDEITVSPEVFSPDNDGYDDWVYIAYKPDKAGYTANVNIYNSNGILVNRIAVNELLPVEGHFKWNGTYDDKQVAKMGIYIIYIELFDMSGKVKHYKKTCVLGKKF